MLGGLVLDRFRQGAELPTLEVFRWLFIVSGIGRASAALWFIDREPSRHDSEFSSVKIEPKPVE
jgi:hypothetical protein